MKKIIYFTLTLIIFSSFTASAQFWKKNNKETEEVIEKKTTPANPTPPEETKDKVEKVVQKPQEKNTESSENDTKPDVSKTKKKKRNFKKKNTNITQPELDSGTIEQQFEYIITKSTGFKEFQLIRRTSILKVKAHTLDSIKTIRKELIAANKSVSTIEGSIPQLETEITELKSQIEIISKEVDGISMFGAMISKSSYMAIVWSIISILLLALVFILAQFKSSNISNKRSKNDLDKMEKEFDDFRKKALKKEQETMRKITK